MVVLGIDLGTNSSAAALMIKGKIQLISSSNDNFKDVKPFPSIVSFFDDETCLIGRPALEQIEYNPNGTVTNTKAKMGSGQMISVLQKQYHPQFISALLIMQIKTHAEKFANEKIDNAVITVPAFFDDNQRQATRDAGKIAGLNVIQVLNEPVAAAIAYGLDRLEGLTKILVFDMGAGTLDVSILEVESNFFEVLSTTGDTALGGNSIDQILFDYLLDKIKSQNSVVQPDDLSKVQLLRLAESIKIRLSKEVKVEHIEDIVINDSVIHLEISITRQEFNNMIQPVLEKSKNCISNALEQSKLEPKEIDKVILIGGPVKIPAIISMITDILKEPETNLDSTFAVAVGAAIQGAVLSDDRDLPVAYQNLMLLNKTALDLGEHAKKDGHDIIQLMIPKNTTYPTEFTDIFYVNKPMQTKVSIDIWQGDFEQNPGFKGNVRLGQFWITGLKEGIANEIEITYSIDADGIISVVANEIGGDSHGILTINKTGDSVIAPKELDFVQKEVEKIGKKYYRDVMSPYEIPVDDYSFASKTVSDDYSREYGWFCNSLQKAINIIKTHHNHPEYDRTFFDVSNFELFLQLDMQYAYAYILLTGGPTYPIHIHSSLKENTEQNNRILVITLIHELLHAIHPNWGHNKIRPAEKRLANLGGYFDAYREMEVKFLGGKMALCNNTMSHLDQKVRIQCKDRT